MMCMCIITSSQSHRARKRDEVIPEAAARGGIAFGGIGYAAYLQAELVQIDIAMIRQVTRIMLSTYHAMDNVAPIVLNRLC